MNYSVENLILTVLQVKTQKAAALYLGISERTIRRWKNEGILPTSNHLKILRRKAKYVRSKIRKTGAGLSPVPVLTDKPGVDDTLRLSPHRFKFDNFLTLLKWYRDNTDKTLFRFLLRTPKGTSDYPLAQYISSDWMKLKSVNGKASDEFLIDMLTEWLENAFVIRIEKVFVV